MSSNLTVPEYPLHSCYILELMNMSRRFIHARMGISLMRSIHVHVHSCENARANNEHCCCNHETKCERGMNMNEGGVIYKRGNISLIGKITFCGDAVQSSSLWFYPYSLPLHLLYIHATGMLWPSILALSLTGTCTCMLRIIVNGRMLIFPLTIMRMWGKSR